MKIWKVENESVEVILLIDFGSTYTKVVAVDTDKNRLLGCASAYTTVETDVSEGLEHALKELKIQTGDLEFSKRLACSSAAGGLRMVTCGLTPELTAKAASMVAMGAGAKIVGLYSYELTGDDIAEITALAPDILLLTGGTDGGNKKCILHNAEMLAQAQGDFPIIVAGNRSSGYEVMQILAFQRAYLCDNVMPSVNTLNIEPARQMIRDIFLERIVHAKGLTDKILMPTPAAVLVAAELFAKDAGELIAIDLGGATTDIYSIADGAPRDAGVIYKGLPEPYVKRTVEGDIGMRYSASGVIEAAGPKRIAKLAGISEETISAQLKQLTKNVDILPKTNKQKALDFAIAALAVETAVKRHSGSLEEVYTTVGRTFIQTGKDLSGVGKIVMTGGALIHSDRQKELAEFALYSENEPLSLRPKKAELLIDKHYILAAMGLLSGYAPDAALEIMKSSLVAVD